MMNRIKTMPMMFAVLMLALAPIAGAAELPKNAVGAQTSVAMWVDLEQIDGEAIREIVEQMQGIAQSRVLEVANLGVPVGKTEQMIADLTAFRDGLVEAGAQHLVMAAQPPAEDAWSPPFTLMVHSDKDLAAGPIAAQIQEASEGRMLAQLEPAGDGWHTITLLSPEGDQVTSSLPAHDAEAHKAFTSQFALVDNPAFAFAFRMQESTRKMLTDGFNAKKPQGEDVDPMVEIMVGMMQPLLDVDLFGMAIKEVDNKKQFKMQLAFTNAQSANKFHFMHTSSLFFAPGMINNEIQGADNAPTINQLTRFFTLMQMDNNNAGTLELELDQEFFDLAEQIGPVLKGLMSPPKPEA